jgi:hypothetical protein
MIRVHSLRVLVVAGFGLVGASAILAFVGCATAGSPDAPLAVIDAQAEPFDADASDGPTEAGRCAANDCVTYPSACSEATLCRADVVFDLRANLLGIWASGPNDVWTAGTLGTVIHYDGTAWHSVPTGRKETLHSLWGNGPGNVWLAGTNDFVLHSQASTSTSGVWEVYDAFDGMNQACPISGLWGSATGGIWGTLQCLNASSPFPTPTNTVLHSSGWQADGGPTWDLEYQTVTIARSYWDVHAVFGFGERDMWVGGSGGVLLRRRTVTPEIDSGVDETNPWFEVNSHAADTINSIGGSGPTDVWMVGDLGLIRHWNGTAIDSIDVPAGIPKVDFHGVWASSPDDVWIVGQDALLIHYDGVRFTRVPVGGLTTLLPTFRKVWKSETTQQLWVVGDGILLGVKTGAIQ